MLSIRLCFPLHALLFFSKSDVHFLEGDLVECPAYLQSFRLLVLPQSFTGRVVELSDLLSVVKTARFKKGLGLVDLVFRGTKDRTTFGLLRGCRSPHC